MTPWQAIALMFTITLLVAAPAALYLAAWQPPLTLLLLPDDVFDSPPIDTDPETIRLNTARWVSDYGLVPGLLIALNTYGDMATTAFHIDPEETP